MFFNIFEDFLSTFDKFHLFHPQSGPYQLDEFKKNFNTFYHSIVTNAVSFCAPILTSFSKRSSFILRIIGLSVIIIFKKRYSQYGFLVLKCKRYHVYLQLIMYTSPSRSHFSNIFIPCHHFHHFSVLIRAVSSSLFTTVCTTRSIKSLPALFCRHHFPEISYQRRQIPTLPIQIRSKTQIYSNGQGTYI